MTHGAGLRWLGMFGVRGVAVLVTAALTLTMAPVSSAEAIEVRNLQAERLLGAVSIARFEVPLSNGSLARGNVIGFTESDPDVEFRSALARGTVAGTEGMVPLATRALGQGAIAGINGGYRLPRAPWGAPNGLFVDRGRLEQGQAVNQAGLPTGRGMVGWTPGGQVMMDRISVTHTYDRLGAAVVGPINELNRQPWLASEMLLYTDRFGTAVTVPAGSSIATLAGLELRSTGRSEGQVTEVRQVERDTTVAVPVGHHLLVATGSRRAEVADAVPGEVFGVTTTIEPTATAAGAWDGLYSGVAGGQLLVQDGQRLSSDTWTDLAAFGDDHVFNRHPRTAIGRTGDGEVLLVTVDGRQSGWSSGLTMRELADVMIALGARDAVNLDGGGATTMTVDGAIWNRPSESGRAVMDGLFLHVEMPQSAREMSAACGDDIVLVSASFEDTAGTTHEASIECLYGWGVTTGVTPAAYDPNGSVTRAQMASFLARWIDDHAARGAGAALPETAELVFTDVSSASAHADAIARLSEAGIISGRTATTYHPWDPVTRAQTASLISGAIAHSSGSTLAAGRDTFFDDNASAHEANVNRLAATGIVAGTGGFSYRPSDAVTRGAMASIMMRGTAQLVEAGVAVPPDDEPTLVGADG
ncbi:MAG: phosphodiester glycosidase family protein [Nitriliruptoraceae bacterium]